MLDRLRYPADPSAAFMRVYSSTEPPQAFVRFCEEYPEECAASSRAEGRVPASPELLTELDQVNGRINRSITAERDLKHYGIADYWTLPTDGKGDCEDYALLKRHELIRLGWPSSALLMTIVKDEKGEGHAVLTARTAAGDFILDNKVDEIRLWTKTPTGFFSGSRISIRGFGWISIRPMMRPRCRLRVSAHTTEPVDYLTTEVDGPSATAGQLLPNSAFATV